MNSLATFMQEFPDDQEPTVYNQDLVGFFTSIPVDCILKSVQWLIDRYLVKRNNDLEDVIFSVNLKEKDTKLRIWKGKQRRSAMRAHTIHLKDVVISASSVARSACSQY